MPLDTSTSEFVVKARPFEAVDPANRLYKKEVIYEGEFCKYQINEDGTVKRDVSGRPIVDHKFTVTKEDILHWADVGKKQIQAGLKIPMPVLHKVKKGAPLNTADPTHNQGYWEAFGTEVRPTGELALVAYAKAKDEEAEKIIKGSDVSIYSPPDAPDGKGNIYHRPIDHICLTNKAVIPGLSPFTAVAASFFDPEDGRTEEKVMNEFLKKLMESKGITIPKDCTDEQAWKLINQHDEKLKVEAEKAKTPQTPPTSEKKEGDDTKTPEAIAASFAPVIPMLVDARKTKLDGLVSGGHITPATRDELAKKHATKEAVTLCLSFDPEGSQFNDLCSALEKNVAVKLDGRSKTGPQDRKTLEASHGDPNKPAESGLVANAKARALAKAGKK